MSHPHRALFDEYLPRIMQCRLDDLVLQTPVQEMPALAERLGVRILVKREDLQPVFSFKIRGAYNKIAGLSDDDKQKGVIAVSAGNHAQGVALAAKHLGVDALIVMPVTTPLIKVDAVRRMGAEIVLHGSFFSQTTQE